MLGGDAPGIVRLMENYWQAWDRTHAVPSGCYQERRDKPFSYVCGPRLIANESDVKSAVHQLKERFTAVRVNSRDNAGVVFDHKDISPTAAIWTLEHGDGCERAGTDRISRTCLTSIIYNEAIGAKRPAQKPSNRKGPALSCSVLGDCNDNEYCDFGKNNTAVCRVRPKEDPQKVR